MSANATHPEHQTRTPLFPLVRRKALIFLASCKIHRQNATCVKQPDDQPLTKDFRIVTIILTKTAASRGPKNPPCYIYGRNSPCPLTGPAGTGGMRDQYAAGAQKHRDCQIRTLSAPMPHTHTPFSAHPYGQTRTPSTPRSSPANPCGASLSGHGSPRRKY